MNFLALLLGLAVERLLTHLFHLREFRWLDPLFDWFFGRFGEKDNVAMVTAISVLLLVILAPVAVVYFGLFDRLAQIPLFLFSVFVLLFCLGPRDLAEEVNDYRRAIADNDFDEVQALAAELLEYSPEISTEPPDVEKAIYSQANNRIFGVVFWFAVLGPLGAWLFRVLDLMRRRAAHHHQAIDGKPHDNPSPIVALVFQIHRIFAWIPSRLLMVGYALAGSYDGAVSAWRENSSPGAFAPENERLVSAVGCGAAPAGGEHDVSERAQIAIDLVIRTLWMIWCPARKVKAIPVFAPSGETKIQATRTPENSSSILYSRCRKTMAPSAIWSPMCLTAPSP